MSPSLFSCLLFAWLTGALCACAPSPQTTHQPHSPASEPPSLMTDPDFVSANYAVGNAAFHGRTTIELLASGELNVSVEQGESSETYTKKLSDAEFQEILGQLMAIQPCKLRPQRENGNPGEDQVAFQLVQTAGSCEVRFWINERWDQEGLKQLVDLFRSLKKSALEE